MHLCSTLLENITVAAGTGQRHSQDFCVEPVDQHPVWSNVAFPVSSPDPGKLMVPVLLRQGLPLGDLIHYLLEQFLFSALLLDLFAVLPKLGGRGDGVLSLSILVHFHFLSLSLRFMYQPGM